MLLLRDCQSPFVSSELSTESFRCLITENTTRRLNTLVLYHPYVNFQLAEMHSIIIKNQYNDGLVPIVNHMQLGWLIFFYLFIQLCCNSYAGTNQ